MKKRILIVDDEPGFTRLLKLLLEKTGRYEVQEQNDSSLAVETAREFAPDLIFLDIVMPGMDGGDVAFQLQCDSMLSTTPIVFLTAVVSKNESPSEKRVAGFPFLAKPVVMHQLIETIEAHLRQTELAA